MRWIQKKTEPRELQEWCARYQGDINYNYQLLRGAKLVMEALVTVLLREQGHLCAYTGLRIGPDSFHIEHLLPQDHCHNHEDVDYRNLVACFPGPNGERCEYGAHPKENWPSPEERHFFVSPLEQGCEQRFIFTLTGEIKCSLNDAAAKETIKRLKLCHPDLTKLRRAAVQGTLGKKNNLSLRDARKILRNLENNLETERLPQFVFVRKQALQTHIDRIEGARKGMREQNGRKRAH